MSHGLNEFSKQGTQCRPLQYIFIKLPRIWAVKYEDLLEETPSQFNPWFQFITECIDEVNEGWTQPSNQNTEADDTQVLFWNYH